MFIDSYKIAIDIEATRNIWFTNYVCSQSSAVALVDTVQQDVEQPVTPLQLKIGVFTIFVQYGRRGNSQRDIK